MSNKELEQWSLARRDAIWMDIDALTEECVRGYFKGVAAQIVIACAHECVMRKVRAERDRLLEACKAFYVAMNSDEQVGELMKAYKVAADAIALAEGGEEK